MTFAAAGLVALALSANPARPEPPAGEKPLGKIAVCTKYRAQAEKNDLAKEDEVAGWAAAALDRSSLRDDASPCFLHVRITAGPISSGGREDGWVAHVAVSIRRYLREGKLVTNERGMLLVDPKRDALVPRAQRFVEDCVAKLK